MVLLCRCRIVNSAEQPTGTHDKQHPVPGPVINALSLVGSLHSSITDQCVKIGAGNIAGAALVLFPCSC